MPFNIPAIREKLSCFSQTAQTACLGVSSNGLSVVVETVRSCLKIRVLEASASLTFYMLFSLFPLLLIIVAGTSYILKDYQAQEQILEVILEILPAVSHQIIRQNMSQLLESRGTVGIVGAAALLWAASSVFSTLVHNLNRAWPDARKQNLFKTRLKGFLIVASLMLTLPCFFIVKAVFNLVSDLNMEYGGRFFLSAHIQPYISLIIHTLSNLVIYMFIFGVFLYLYKYVPKTAVRWSEAAAGALVACIGGGLATYGFSWFLSSGLSKHNVIYGSLGALVAFFYWIYIVNLIVLFGAHLGASLSRLREIQKKES